ncbi:hypothetical protein [Nostocoides sp. Soil756]|jgi:hypothetical protein|uniref:hypothetical protein n=1 Tax=Nostocoides sp. Soil756 TaxID=1736399 RepID=UPI0006F8F67D|nr:hypothetical protein [Tetrasphaera sp. Soil756]KRE62123.1 hypothetical protein ASG78_03460 [Tetrasphaera sp. Soil756]
MTTPVPPPDPPARPQSSRGRTLALSAVVAAVGLGGVGIAALTDRLDTALLFVGVPCLLAFVIGRIRGNGGWGQVFQVLTVVLLLAAALLQEGAICVFLTAPLVYGVAGLVYAVAAHERRRAGSLVLVPVVAMVMVEGVLPGTRIHPDQQAVAERVVADRCTAFEAALARGPRIDAAEDRGALLSVFRYPTPTAATGAGLEPGDHWTLTLADGRVRTHVTAREGSTLRFALDEDTTKLKKWAAVRGGTLTWRDGSDGCRATLTVDYERRLDPAFWFGPVTGAFMDAGAAAFLAGLD